MAFLKRFAGAYVRLMDRYPWTVTSTSTGVLCCTGDLLAQQVIEKRGFKHHNIRRSVKFFAMGCMIGPSLRMWFMYLDRIIPGTDSVPVLKKVLLDQGAWAPMLIAAFFTTSDLLDGKSFANVKENLNTSYVSALKANWTIWPAIQLINFYITPLKYRVIVVNFVALFWNTYLAWVVSNSNKK